MHIKAECKSMLGLHRIPTNLGTIYELKKIWIFLDSWIVVQLWSSDRKLALT